MRYQNRGKKKKTPQKIPETPPFFSPSSFSAYSVSPSSLLFVSIVAEQQGCCILHRQARSVHALHRVPSKATCRSVAGHRAQARTAGNRPLERKREEERERVKRKLCSIFFKKEKMNRLKTRLERIEISTLSPRKPIWIPHLLLWDYYSDESTCRKRIEYYSFFVSYHQNYEPLHPSS